jgi:carbon monoxide dehydrogenase subunit G
MDVKPTTAVKELARRTFEVDASPAKVWRLIGKVIFNCLPGMEEIDVVDEKNFRALQRMKIVFMEVRMRLKGEIVDITPPRSLAVNLAIEGAGGLVRMNQKVTIGMSATEAGRTEVTCEATAASMSGWLGWLLLSQARPFVQSMFEAMEKRLQYLVSA